MTDFIDYIEKHPALFGGLATSAAGCVPIVVGWIIPYLWRQRAEEKQRSEEKSAIETRLTNPEKEDIAIQSNEEKNWRTSYPAALTCANWYRDLLTSFYGKIPVKFGKTMITL